jgi:hypothetical protein
MMVLTSVLPGNSNNRQLDGSRDVQQPDNLLEVHYSKRAKEQLFFGTFS